MGLRPGLPCLWAVALTTPGSEAPEGRPCPQGGVEGSGRAGGVRWSRGCCTGSGEVVKTAVPCQLYLPTAGRPFPWGLLAVPPGPC